MAKIMVVYGTTEGHTNTIAHYVATTAHDEGNDVEILDSLNLAPSVLRDPWDAVIIGGSVHQGIHQTYLTEFVKSNKAWLSQRPGAFFSVSLSAAVEDPFHQQEAHGYVESFLDETQWQPQVKTCFPGALRYAEYDYFKRLVLKYLSAQLGPGILTDHDIVYTNWDEVKRFTQTFLKDMTETRVVKGGTR